MRIGIDCRTILNPAGGELAGVGHYTDHLVRTLAQEYPNHAFVLFFNQDIDPPVIQSFSSYANVKTILLRGSEYRRSLPFVYPHLCVPVLAARERLDLFHGPAYVTPLAYRHPTVVTVHDLAMYKHPEWFPEETGFSQKILVPSSLKRAKKVIAVSKATATQIKELFPEVHQKTAVVYEGVEPQQKMDAQTVSAVQKKFTITDRFVFFIGTIEPRKNIERLIKAFDQWKSENTEGNEDVQFVIAGGKGWKSDAIYTAAENARWKESIRFIGYITAEEKQALMQACTVFTFPSLWEGFGLPVLEAAAAGAAILTSRISALPEVADKGAYYVDPIHIGSMKNGITELMRDEALRKKLSASAREQASLFTWKKTAQETMRVYEQIVT